MQREYVKKKSMKRTLMWLLIFLVIYPGLFYLMAKFNNTNTLALISTIAALCACVPFFVMFENRKPKARELVLVSMMTALTVAGRVVFNPLPAFKPVSAMAMISGIYLGPEIGFLTGSLGAIVSNMFYGQGPWTPFQMLAWGLIGFLAGLFQKIGLFKHKWVLYLYAAFAGILYSGIVDIWSVLRMDGYFNWTRYLVYQISAIPFTVTYAVSNVLLLLVLEVPIGKKLTRLTHKYNFFSEN